MSSNETLPPTDEDFLVAVEEALETHLLPTPGFAVLERTRDAVVAALGPLVQQLRGAPAAPAAAPSAPADRAALHNLVAAALASKFTRDGDVNQGMRVLDDDTDAPAARRVRPVEAADVVLAMLPAPAEQAAAWQAVAAECDKAGSAYAERGANDAAGAAFALMEHFLRKADEAEYVATPCSVGGCEPGGEPCSTHERLMAHAEGDHELCEPDCGVAPAVLPAPADRAALRDLAADALADAEGWQWAPGYDKAQSPTYQHYLRQADAVLSVLPEPADRTVILREAADVIEEAQHRRDDIVNDALGFLDNNTEQQDIAVHRSARLLRRMADEAPANIQCPDAFWTKQPHAPHDWQQRPDAPPVHCPGMNGEASDPSRVAGEAQQPASTAPLAASLPLVKGRCPACNGASLFLGDGGYVTCSRIDCPEPDAASTALEQPAVGAQQPETPKRPPMDPVHILGIGAAEARQADTAGEQQ